MPPARHTRKPVMAELLRLSNEGFVDASIRSLAEATGRSRSSINRCIQELSEEGLLRVVHQGTGAGYPTTYQIFFSLEG